MAAPAAAPPPAAWHYQWQGQQVGPVSQPALMGLLQSGEITIDTPVWREGLPAWAPLGEALGIPGWLPGPERRKISNANQNCIAMFAVGMLGLVALIGSVIASMMGREVSTGWVGGAALVAGGFAVIYLPLRWQTIMKLPGASRVLGLIGGFVLIGIFALGLVGLVIVAGR